jgi:NAD(P)H dehydrogenase (quinone)
MADVSNARLLITGASGGLGRFTLTNLLDTHKVAPDRIIAATRNPEALAEFAARGVDVRKADFDDTASLPLAFAGANRMMLISTNALMKPGQRVAHQRAAVEAAVKAGVSYAIYTSGPAPRPDAAMMDDHYWTEQAIAASGMEFTILRNNIYSESILRGVPAALSSGKLITAMGKRGRSYVSRDDCARTAAAALVTLTGKKILDVTGPGPVTQSEIATMLSELTGRQVVHVNVTPEEIQQSALAANVPPILAAGRAAFETAVLQGYHAIVTPTVKELTGRDPISVREFLTGQRAALVAQAGSV